MLKISLVQLTNLGRSWNFLYWPEKFEKNLNFSKIITQLLISACFQTNVFSPEINVFTFIPISPNAWYQNLLGMIGWIKYFFMIFGANPYMHHGPNISSETFYKASNVYWYQHYFYEIRIYCLTIVFTISSYIFNVSINFVSVKTSIN